MMPASQTTDIEKNGPPSDQHVKSVQQQVQEVKAVRNLSNNFIILSYTYRLWLIML